jgi:hypothetical protein
MTLILIPFAVAIYNWIIYFDKKERLFIDKNGLHIGSRMNQILWSDVLELYVRDDNASENNTIELVVLFYSRNRRQFEETAVTINGLYPSMERVLLSCWYFWKERPGMAAG